MIQLVRFDFSREVCRLQLSLFDQPAKMSSDELFGHRPQDELDLPLRVHREVLAMRMSEGSYCPCCNQRAQLYVYSFHSGMVKSLAYIVEAYEIGRVKWGEFFHVEHYLKKEKVVNFHGYHSKLKFWGMLELAPNDDPTKSTSGFWRITDTGLAFARDEISVPKKALLFNGECFGFDGDRVRASDVLDDYFNYSKMMGRRCGGISERR